MSQSHPAVRIDDGRRGNGVRRLSVADILAIQGHFVAGLTLREIGAAFGVHHSRVGQLVRDMPGPRKRRLVAPPADEPTEEPR